MLISSMWKKALQNASNSSLCAGMLMKELCHVRCFSTVLQSHEILAVYYAHYSIESVI